MPSTHVSLRTEMDSYPDPGACGLRDYRSLFEVSAGPLASVISGQCVCLVSLRPSGGVYSVQAVRRCRNAEGGWPLWP